MTPFREVLAINSTDLNMLDFLTEKINVLNVMNNKKLR